MTLSTKFQILLQIVTISLYFRIIQKLRNFVIRMKLEGYIAALLKDHNCVIVPDFGGFVANYRSAVIDEFSKKIHPPSKSILFNPKLTNNDGLLGNYISQKQSIDYPSALNYIIESVAEWRKGFEKGDRIEVGEVGFLYQENGVIHFEQSREVNLLLQAYGLRSIHFVKFNVASNETKVVKSVEEKPIEKTEPVVEEKQEVAKEVIKQEPVKVIELVDETPVKKEEKKSDKEATVIALNKTEKIERVKEQKKSEHVVPKKRKVAKTVMRYAAAVIFVPVLFYSYWIPMETDALETSMIQLNDFNPIHEQVKKTYEHRTEKVKVVETEESASWEELTDNINASVYNFELSEDFYVPVSLDKTVFENSTSDHIESVNTSTQNEVIAGNYHVIAGCFSVKQNAENLVKDLKSQGFSAAILDKSGGLTRVSAGGYNTRDAAEAGLDKLKGSGNSGWILKK